MEKRTSIALIVGLFILVIVGALLVAGKVSAAKKGTDNGLFGNVAAMFQKPVQPAYQQPAYKAPAQPAYQQPPPNYLAQIQAYNQQQQQLAQAYQSMAQGQQNAAWINTGGQFVTGLMNNIFGLFGNSNRGGASDPDYGYYGNYQQDQQYDYPDYNNGAGIDDYSWDNWSYGDAGGYNDGLGTLFASSGGDRSGAADQLRNLG